MDEPANRGASTTEARRGRRRLLVVLVAAALALVVLPACVLLYAAVRLDGNLTRVDGVFAGLEGRPPVRSGAEAATNILVVATDRSADAGDDPAVPETDSDDLAQQAARRDTLMLLHIDGERRAAAVVSIPRDTRVDVPGHGVDRIGTALSLGGPRLAVGTVEHLTGVRVDHLAIIDWTRFGALVDAVGGISVDVATTVHDPRSGTTWVEGRNELDGAAAVEFVRFDDGMPGGALDRIARQHAVLRAVMADALEQEMRKNPLLLHRFLDTVTDHLAVDDGWSGLDMASLVFSMRDFRTAGASYVTMPVAVSRPDSGEDAVRPDGVRSHALWQAVADDRLSTWLSQHPDALTPWAVS